jgi:hypothetical protein
MSRVSWNFGDDPWWTLGGVTDRFGVGDGFGMSVSAQGLDELEAELMAGTFRPFPSRRVLIPKPGTAEQRPLSIPTEAA